MKCLLIVIPFCMLTACKDNESSTDTNGAKTDLELVGKWDMVTAYKGDKESKMLNKGYFTFDTLGQFSTNILGDNKLYAYKQSGQQIIVKDPQKSKYNVISKTKDTLILTAKLRNFNFKFITAKSTK